MVAERATVRETPNHKERATAAETPTGQERATAAETPNPEERARIPETPTDDERARRMETPRYGERANRRKTPMVAERATENETPTSVERAVYVETPKNVERATSNETPKTAERAPPGPWSAARSAVDSYYDLQRLRIAVEHRVKRLRAREIAAEDHIGTLTSLGAELVSREKELVALLGATAGTHPVYPWLIAIRGIGPVLSAGLLAYFDVGVYPAEHYDPKKKKIVPHPKAGMDRAPHASSFWKFAGLYPGARLTKGETAPFSHGAKVLCWKVATSFLKCDNPRYVPFYREAKLKYEAYPEIHGKKPGQLGFQLYAHNMALRVMVKRFIADFWVQYRKAFDLPVDDPYVVAILGHEEVR